MNKLAQLRQGEEEVCTAQTPWTLGRLLWEGWGHGVSGPGLSSRAGCCGRGGGTGYPVLVCPAGLAAHCLDQSCFASTLGEK